MSLFQKISMFEVAIFDVNVTGISSPLFGIGETLGCVSSGTGAFKSHDHPQNIILKFAFPGWHKSKINKSVQNSFSSSNRDYL